MKMIEVLQKVANGEIKDQTTLKIYDTHVFHTYTFEGKYNSFYSNTKYRRELGGYFKISGDFLNYDAELIPPKPKKYRVRFKLLGSSKKGSFLSLEKCPYGVFLSIQEGTGDIKTQFTKSELQSIKPVKEFLDDMQGKFELIEVEDDEDY
ncbi:hypothetical protein CIRMBP1307_00328 [Enterococcus cecorum]|uniref:hypothetical protein n=1 Tax=Enterococcus cecorum TaxID=44008 RepID=UPI000AF70747|nr:hypothetical protein [Enterococcus cecorum]CAI3336605.1 hypothetical protein CIRMBP1307_00328 [Enterococcus cecorum]